MGDYTKEVGWLLEEKYGGVATLDFQRDCDALLRGVPLAYLIGHVPFLDATIYLDSRPLIPRTETEYWVTELIERHRAVPPARVLDLCAGSGCIGVALAKAFPRARVDFVEIDTAHHTTIEKNVRENGIDASRATILGGDLFEHVDDSYDLIVSNPPYLGTDRTNDVADSVIDHEPPLALFAGCDGLDHIRRIIALAPQHILPGGTLYIEHEPYQADSIASLAVEIGAHATSLKDQYGLARVTQIRL